MNRYATVGILVGGLAFAGSIEGSSAKSCQEDNPCWAWSKMGNLDRGIYIEGRKTRIVVEPCEFAYLDFKGRIDWKRTKHLKGDSFARKHGCNPRLYAPNA